MSSKTNEALRQMALAAYKRRPVLPEQYQTMYRLEHANGGLLCDIWFMSRGCYHDSQGGCTMCNYGKSSKKVREEEILIQIRKLINSLPKQFEDFLLTPSGSILDDREVTAEFREKLFKEVEAVQAKRFIVETRADTITEEKLKCFDSLKTRMDCYIEIGLESSNNWILKHCINKGITIQEFQRAVGLIHKAGLKVTANVGVGIPFLHERVSVIYTVKTVRDALLCGADSIVLFPYHVKQGTVMRDMERMGMYQCISMWSLIEVLQRLKEDWLDRVQISWYKDYYGKSTSGIYSSPGTCPKCRRKVERMLDQYRDRPSAKIRDSLGSISCECRESWKEKLEKEPEELVYDEIENMYRKLSEYYGINQELLNRELVTMEQEFHKMMMPGLKGNGPKQQGNERRRLQ